MRWLRESWLRCQSLAMLRIAAMVTAWPASTSSGWRSNGSPHADTGPPGVKRPTPAPSHSLARAPARGPAWDGAPALGVPPAGCAAAGSAQVPGSACFSARNRPRSTTTVPPGVGRSVGRGTVGGTVGRSWDGGGGTLGGTPAGTSAGPSPPWPAKMARIVGSASAAGPAPGAGPLLGSPWRVVCRLPVRVVWGWELRSCRVEAGREG